MTAFSANPASDIGEMRISPTESSERSQLSEFRAVELEVISLINKVDAFENILFRSPAPSEWKIICQCMQDIRIHQGDSRIEDGLMSAINNWTWVDDNRWSSIFPELEYYLSQTKLEVENQVLSMERYLIDNDRENEIEVDGDYNKRFAFALGATDQKDEFDALIAIFKHWRDERELPAPKSYEWPTLQAMIMQALDGMSTLNQRSSLYHIMHSKKCPVPEIWMQYESELIVLILWKQSEARKHAEEVMKAIAGRSHTTLATADYGNTDGSTGTEYDLMNAIHCMNTEMNCDPSARKEPTPFPRSSIYSSNPIAMQAAEATPAPKDFTIHTGGQTHTEKLMGEVFDSIDEILACSNLTVSSLGKYDQHGADLVANAFSKLDEELRKPGRKEALPREKEIIRLKKTFESLQSGSRPIRNFFGGARKCRSAVKKLIKLHGIMSEYRTSKYFDKTLQGDTDY